MKKIIFSMIVLVFLSSCAHVQPHAHECLTGHTYGFWGGLWHGLIAPFAFIGHLFNSDIDVFAANNNGGWYMFGFLLGIGAFGGGASKATSRK